MKISRVHTIFRRIVRLSAKYLLQDHQFRKEFKYFKTLASKSEHRFDLRWEDRRPCLNDKTTSTGFDRHYVYHTGWASRVLSTVQPRRHIDIGSTLYFCSIISGFIPVEFYDYRPATLVLGNLLSGSADLLALPFPSESCESISCMHVVEHIGLGRYGEPLDPEGDLKAIDELKRVLAPGGILLFVVPIGQPRICFNAHRIYSYKQIVEYFAGLTLCEFALVTDEPNTGGLIRNASPAIADKQNYGCGCFWFSKK